MPKISAKEAQQIGIPLPSAPGAANLQYDTGTGNWYADDAGGVTHQVNNDPSQFQNSQGSGVVAPQPTAVNANNNSAYQIGGTSVEMYDPPAIEGGSVPGPYSIQSQFPDTNSGDYNLLGGPPGGITPMSDTYAPGTGPGPNGQTPISGSYMPFGHNFLPTDNSYSSDPGNGISSGDFPNIYNTPSFTPNMSPVVGGNPIDQYTGGSYNASGAGAPYSDTSLSSFDQPAPMAQIANLPPEMQDYYGARGVQNFDPNNLYTNAVWGPPPTSVSPYGNLPVAALPTLPGGASGYIPAFTTPSTTYGPISYAPPTTPEWTGNGGGGNTAWTGEGGTNWGGTGGGDLFS